MEQEEQEQEHPRRSQGRGLQKPACFHTEENVPAEFLGWVEQKGVVVAAAATTTAATATPSSRAFMFSLENAVCKDSYRRTWQQHRQSPHSPVRILTDRVLQRENKRAWARSYCRGSESGGWGRRTM